jgi:hypothetical protein
LDSTFFWLLLTAAFSALSIGTVVSRRRRIPFSLRRIEAYRTMPLNVDGAVESNQRIHFSVGGAAVGQSSTLTALAGLSTMYILAERQAFASNVPIITLTDPITLAIAQDMLRRAYLSRNNLKTYQANTVIWYPQSERSLAFGAGAATLIRTRDVSGNILLGEFGPELAFIGEASIRRDTFFVGHSTRLEGQAIAYAQSDNPLIGEELFVGNAYLTPENPSNMGSVMAMDVLRWVIIAAIILVALVNAN